MGYSDSGPRPRTSQQIVRELRALLDGSGVRGRVILVGASVGGWNMRLFASIHEEQTAGLVLVDARHEEQGQRLVAAGSPDAPPWLGLIARLAPVVAHVGLARAAGIAPGPPPDAIAASLQEFAQATRFRSSALVTTADELRHASQSAGQVKAARRTLDIPLVVVSAGRRAERVAEILNDLQHDQVALSTRSCQVVAERSGHAVALDQPQIVVDAIRATVEASRQGTASPDCQAITQSGPEVSSVPAAPAG
jgi:pimeloyl-ACP methyl ester carboxylesterase